MSVAASFLDIGDEKEVVDYVREMTPLICLSIIMDNLQAVLSGSFRAPLHIVLQRCSLFL